MDTELSSGGLLLKNRKNSAVNIILYALIIFSFGLVLFYAFLGFVPVDGESMENSVHDGQYVVLLRNVYSVERGDIITVNTAQKNEPEHLLIKRVIGKAGDRIVFMRDKSGLNVDLYICKAGERTFKLVHEPYIRERMRASVDYGDAKVLEYVDEEIFTQIDIYAPDGANQTVTRDRAIAGCVLVPSNCLYFMGDNRNHSQDSRFYGCRPLSSMTGKAIILLEANSAKEKFFRFMFNYY